MIAKEVLKMRFKQSWWAMLILAALLLFGLTSCRGSVGESAVEPAVDRATFVWIFSDP